MRVAAAGAVLTAAAGPVQVQALKITLLSTMLADGDALGEWGFAALVEVDGRRLLFDTGAHSDLVRRNAQTLGIDLTTVPEVILTHHHSDHVGGLLTLRDVVRVRAPTALARAHVGAGIFLPRSSLRRGIDDNPMRVIKAEYERMGGSFVEHAEAAEIHPGVWLTGPVPRKYPERNWSGAGQMKTEAGWVEDNLPEDQALVFNTTQGLVVLCGCGHAGVINTLDYARRVVRDARICALIGGIHLFAASEETLRWTGQKLGEFGVDNLIGAHCTGIEATYRLRAALGLARTHAVVGAVGASFELGAGINAGAIAR